MPLANKGIGCNKNEPDCEQNEEWVRARENERSEYEADSNMISETEIELEVETVYIKKEPEDKPIEDLSNVDVRSQLNNQRNSELFQKGSQEVLKEDFIEENEIKKEIIESTSQETNVDKNDALPLDNNSKKLSNRKLNDGKDTRSKAQPGKKKKRQRPLKKVRKKQVRERNGLSERTKLSETEFVVTEPQEEEQAVAWTWGPAEKKEIDRQRKIKKRESENAEERKARLERDRTRKSLARLNETPEHRKARLDRDRRRKAEARRNKRMEFSQIKLNERLEQLNSQLENKLKKKSLANLNETPEQRNARLKNRRKKLLQAILSDTSEQKNMLLEREISQMRLNKTSEEQTEKKPNLKLYSSIKLDESQDQQTGIQTVRAKVSHTRAVRKTNKCI